MASPFAHLALELIVTSVAPPRCAACDRRVALRTVFCAPCAHTLVRCEQSSPSDRVGFEYGGAIEQAIHRFKFGGREDLGAPLADALFRAVSNEALVADVVVPVPLHPMRLVERGYNQAALLARPIARRLDARILPSALARTRNTAHQVGLGREERDKNVEGSIALRATAGIEGALVLLVDDVKTTGATLTACRRALLNGGAREVMTLALAGATCGRASSR